MKYLFGPVRSRRLGRSLGIDLLPDKICSFDCLYCEVGPTTLRTCQRREYTPVFDLLKEIDLALAEKGIADVDAWTVTARGEPTLHSGFGQVVHHLRRHCGRPVIVLTNGTLLQERSVRRELAEADIVMPSLDAARPDSLARVNRPAPEVDLAGMIEGLIALFGEHPGAVWLEILLVAGCNDSDEDIDALAGVLRRLGGDPRHRVQLNTVTRPSRTARVDAVAPERLERIAARLQESCALPLEVLAATPFSGGSHDVDVTAPAPGRLFSVTEEAQGNRIVEMVRRRPCTADELCAALGLPARRVLLEELVAAGRLRLQRQGGAVFYLPPS